MKKLYIILTVVAALTMSAHAQTEGTINVGDWDNATTTYSGSDLEMAPTNFHFAHTGAQMIYTPDLLTDLDGKQNVKITKLQYKFYSTVAAWQEIIRDVKVYLKEIDATEFGVDNGIKLFFDFDGSATESHLDLVMPQYYDGCTLEFPVDFAFTPGKSLLVTILFDSPADNDYTDNTADAPFYTSGIGGKCMTYTNIWYSFNEYAQGQYFPYATAPLGCGSDVELPCTQISYTYGDVQLVHDENFFLVGTFNGWDQTAEGGRIAFDENDQAEVEFEAGAEFKLITYDYQGNLCWFGGADDNNVGYFLINNDLLGQDIVTVQGDDGANFRIEEAGTYELGLSVMRDFNGSVSMTVIKKSPESITTIGSDSNVDNNWYNLQGQRFNSKPTVPGIYIYNGEKVVVK